MQMMRFKDFFQTLISIETDEVRAKREPSLCNESVNGHFWSNLSLNCIFKWTWFVKKDIWSVIDRSRVRFPVAASWIFSPHISLFWLGSPSVPLEFPTLDPYVVIIARSVKKKNKARLFFQSLRGGVNRFHGSKDVRSRSFKAWTFQEIETFKLDLKEDEQSSL